MKIFIALTIIFFTLTLQTAAAPNQPGYLTSENNYSPVNLFGLSLGMHSNDLIDTLKINSSSKVLVGNTNNPRAIDFSIKRRKIIEQFHSKYPRAEKKLFDSFIKNIIPIKVGHKNYEVSCSDKFCNTDYFSKNNINYFIARFNSQGLLGNLSLHQQIPADIIPSNIIKNLIHNYGQTKILGNFKRSKRGQLNYSIEGKYNFRIKIIATKNFTKVEYSLQDINVFMQDLDEANRLIKGFELLL